MASEITAFNVLQPSVVRTIREAFDDAVKEIETRRGAGAPLPEDARCKLARRLVELARHGECDLQRLRSEAIRAVPV